VGDLIFNHPGFLNTQAFGTRNYQEGFILKEIELQPGLRGFARENLQY